MLLADQALKRSWKIIGIIGLSRLTGHGYLREVLIPFEFRFVSFSRTFHVSDLDDAGAQIGYYHLCGIDASVLHGTDFQDFGFVFAGAWARIAKAIETAERYGIGVLLGTYVCLLSHLLYAEHYLEIYTLHPENKIQIRILERQIKLHSSATRSTRHIRYTFCILW